MAVIGNQNTYHGVTETRREPRNPVIAVIGKPAAQIEGRFGY
jgi:hypothetical protein